MHDYDTRIGIIGYVTKTAGIRGRIRHSVDDFVVEEVIDRRYLESIQAQYQGPSFAIFTLAKTNIDTIHAVKAVSRMFGCGVRILGLKDSRASTKQYLAFRVKRPFSATLKSRNDFDLLFLGYSKHIFSHSLLRGNSFRVTVREIRVDNHAIQETIGSVAAALSERRLPNFYGYQRFGTTRPVTHLVGKSIVQGRFDEAIRTLVAFESGTADDEIIEARRLFLDGRLKDSLRYFRTGYDIERNVITALLERHDFLRALRKISLRVRKLFLAAYSSYMFNIVLSKAIEREEDFSPRKGDVVAEFSPDYQVGKPFLYDLEKNSTNLVPLVATAGYGYYPKKSRFDLLLQEVMRGEGVAPKMFYVRDMPEISLSTGLRPAPLLGGHFRYGIGHTDALLEFFLSKGAYATVLLREVMKPEDSSKSGF